MAITVPLPRILILANSLHNPPWPTVQRLRRADIGAAIERGDLASTPVAPEAAKRHHVARIAWFVCKGWDDAIQIDLGCPGFPGFREFWPISDGNHRLAAAAYRADATILVEWGGLVDRAKSVFGDVVVENELADTPVIHHDDRITGERDPAWQQKERAP